MKKGTLPSIILIVLIMVFPNAFINIVTLGCNLFASLAIAIYNLIN